MSQTADGLRFVAFYLPQYHPIPENDEWWGPGFTEWRNVVKGKALFRGHYQPHLPADLGFYDLRLPEVRQQQAQLAARYGIDAFCYYHYWFNGRRLLERPFTEVLDSGQPSLPFCLCWANESWTRAWDGWADQILIEQTYSPEDDMAHALALSTAFADPRYLRIDGRPVFLVYQPSALPDPVGTARRFRSVARSRGIGGLYMCAVHSHMEPRVDPSAIGFDAAIEFQPDPTLMDPLPRPPLPVRAFRRFFNRGHRTRSGHSFRSYPRTIEAALARSVPYKQYPCVMPGWDNSARRTKGGTIFLDSTPERYREWILRVKSEFMPYSPEENLVFINAWNEWAEGNHLEPDERWGYAFLDATLEARQAPH